MCACACVCVCACACVCVCLCLCVCVVSNSVLVRQSSSKLQFRPRNWPSLSAGKQFNVPTLTAGAKRFDDTKSTLLGVLNEKAVCNDKHFKKTGSGLSAVGLNAT